MAHRPLASCIDPTSFPRTVWPSVDHAQGRPVDQSCSDFGLRIRRSTGRKPGELGFSPIKIGIKNVTSLCRSKRFP